MLVPVVASAQPGSMPSNAPGATPSLAVDPAVLSLARAAHGAGARGDCVGARILAARILRLDPDFHRAAIATDPAIASCRPAPRTPVVEVEPEAESGAEHGPIRDGTPPLSGGTVVGQLLVGTLTAALGATAGGYLGYSLETRGGCGGEWCGLGGLLIGGTIGMVIGAPFGVKAAGDSGDAEGSFGATLAGSAVGTLVGIALLAADDNDATGIVFLASPMVGATIGYSLSRRYKRGPRRIAFTPSIAPIDHGVGMTLLGGSF